MDAQLVNDFVSISLAVRARELQDECDQLQSRVNELECAYERKQDELERLRRTVKNERALKQSALAKLAQIDFGAPTISRGIDQWRSASEISTNAGSSSSDRATSTSSMDADLQRRLLELELELVSKERENLMKHKTIIDHFEELLHEKRIQSSAKEGEVRRVRSELSRKQSTIDEMRQEMGLPLRIVKSPSSAPSTASSI